MQEGNSDTFNGFSLYSSIEDEDTRAHNRAAALFNMFDIHSKRGKVGASVAADMLEYLQLVPPIERGAVVKKLSKLISEE